MNKTETYPIGKAGVKWETKEKTEWLERQSIKRSYKDEVLKKLNGLEQSYDLVQYGVLSCDQQRYPLFILKTKNFDENKKSVLVTGGVHGYETSGVQGAIRFAEDYAAKYTEQFNLIIAPCVSPWGYETINRWNSQAIDPNRSFYVESPAEESALLMAFIESHQLEFVAHIDLHETTDTDNSEFRPALAARDAVEQKSWNIPDGFYLVGDTLKPEAEFQKAVITSVEQVTHIAPADENEQLIGVPLEQFGVINYAAKELGLCMGLTNAQFVTTTEVYPDSPLVDDENCIVAQVAAITGALDFIIEKGHA